MTEQKRYHDIDWLGVLGMIMIFLCYLFGMKG